MNENNVEDKEKLLYLWKRKQDAIEMDIQENKRKLKYAKERQELLKQDIVSQIIIAIVCGIVIWFLFYMEKYIFWQFQVTYYFSIRGILISAILYNGIQLVKGIKRYIFHTKTVENWKKPSVRVFNTDTGVASEISCQMEIQKVSWILEQYKQEEIRLQQIRSDIEQGKIDSIESLEPLLNEIIIYEVIRSAKIKRGWKY